MVRELRLSLDLARASHLPRDKVAGSFVRLLAGQRLVFAPIDAASVVVRFTISQKRRSAFSLF